MSGVKKIKRFEIVNFLFVLLSIFLLFGLHKETYAAEQKQTIIFSIEKFTIGQGYLIEPCVVELQDGDTCAIVLDRVLKENGYGYKNTGTTGFYLASIANADTGVIDIPSCIQRMGDTENANKDEMKPPTNANNMGNLEFPSLGEYAYHNMSGWMFSVNTVFPGTGMDQYVLSDGDIFRVQFTVYGYGADLGSVFGDPETSIALTLPDRDPITRRLALINQNRVACFANEEFNEQYREIYNQALNDVVPDLDIADKQITNMLNALPSEETIAGYVDSYNTLRANELMERINSLGEITLDKEKEVLSIRNTFNAFNDAQKSKVSLDSLEKLTNAEKVIVQIKNEQKADSVISQINALGAVSLSNESQVVAARKAYNALTTEQKSLVSADILSKLTQAEQNLSQLKAQAEAEQAAAEQKALQEAQKKAIQQALIKQNTPVKTTLKSVKKTGAKKAKLIWKKVKAASGYEIYMSTKKSSGYKKIKTIKKAKTVTFTKSGLKKKKTYYFKVRTYRTVNGVTYYGNYSNVKQVKIK